MSNHQLNGFYIFEFFDLKSYKSIYYFNYLLVEFILLN